MKTIQPVTIWLNGQSKQANKFNMNSIFDNLEDSATFYYELLESVEVDGAESLTQLAQGNLSMTGADYALWTGSNDAAYTWGAAQLNLTIIS